MNKAQEFLTTGDKPLRICIPSEFTEITLGQMMDLMKDGNNLVDEVAILTHIPKDELYNIRNIEDLARLKPVLEEITTRILEDYDSDALPSQVTLLSGQVVPISSDLGIHPVGAFIAADGAMQAEIEKAQHQFGDDWEDNFKPSFDCTLTIIAHYLYCDATGLPWTEKGVENFKTSVRWIPAYQAMPITKAFFLPYLSLGKDTRSYWSKALMAARKQRELINLRRSAG